MTTGPGDFKQLPPQIRVEDTAAIELEKEEERFGGPGGGGDVDGDGD